MGRFVWGIGATLLCVSCSLLVSVDGLSDGPGTGATPEGGTSPEASTPEASVLPDGAIADGAARFCDDKKDAKLCEDFDLTALPGKFTGQETKGAKVALARAQPLSEPFALEVVLDPESSAGNDHFANVHAAYPSGPSAITFDVSMRITKIPSTVVSASGFAFEVADASKKGLYDVEIIVNATAAGPTIAMVEYFYTTQTTGAKTPAVAAPMDAWFALRMKVDFVAKTAELFREGQSVGAISLAPPSVVTFPPPYSTLFLGAYSSGKHDGWGFQYDNAAIYTP